MVMGVNVVILYLFFRWGVESIWLFEFLVLLLGFNMERFKDFNIILVFVLCYGFFLFFWLGSVVVLLVMVFIEEIIGLF